MPRASITDVVFDMETQDPDDFLCLLFLASHPRINLKAVTITPGSREQVGIVRWALGILGLDGLPVGAGNIDHPKPAVSPWHLRAFFPAAKSLPSSSNAEKASSVLIRECDANTVLFTGGPLTNLSAAIDEGGEAFVAGCWLGQGGFAGDNIVAPEDRLSKFVGLTHVQTFNFGCNLPAARACLAHGGFRRIRLVSKNVCHAESNRFGPEQLAHLEARLAAASNGPTATRLTGLELLAQGMREYMRRHPSGKLLHDPLAAACILNPHVVEWREVTLDEDRRHAWGSKVREGSGTFISVRHSPEAFWSVLLDDDSDRDGPHGQQESGAAGSGDPEQATASDGWEQDWLGRELPPFVQPARPAGSEGGDALEKLAANPAAAPDRVLFETKHCVVAYDVYPKARVHVLILPRAPLAKPHELAAQHARLLRHMLHLAEWLAPRLRDQHPELSPLRCGFHAVPSMRQMHLHMISLDFESPDLKRPRHWIIFNTDYLVPPQQWADMLEQHGRVLVERTAEEAKLKMPMVCPLTGTALDGMEAVRRHVRSQAYREAVREVAAGEHLIFATR